ncbi:MAG: hypothetical protein Q9216_004625 [Gyalolechia sp. 2 TL-2023]
MEAICQIAHATKSSRPSIALRNIDIIKAFPLSQDPDDVGSEVFITMHITKLSGTIVLSKWHDFEISTYDNYLMRPITIDSLLQTALFASSGATISKVQYIVSTCIEHVQFTLPEYTAGKSEWLVDATSRSTGLGSIEIAAELHDGHGQRTAVPRMENVSAVAFQRVQADASANDSRHHMMKVMWKPDITKRLDKNFSGYADHLNAGADTQDSGIPMNGWKLAVDNDCLCCEEPPYQHPCVGEQKRLHEKFFTYDIDDPEANIEASVTNALATLHDIHDADCLNLKVGEQKIIPFFHCFIPEEELNTSFRQKRVN